MRNQKSKVSTRFKASSLTESTYTSPAQAKVATGESDPLDGLPEIDDSTVESLSEQV